MTAESLPSGRFQAISYLNILFLRDEGKVPYHLNGR